MEEVKSIQEKYKEKSSKKKHSMINVMAWQVHNHQNVLI